MALEDIEIDVGGTKFKGIWIAILFTFGSSLGGGIWAVSSFFSELEAQNEAVEAAVAQANTLEARFADLKEASDTKLQAYQVIISGVEQSLEDNDVAGLQGKLAELGTNLEAIMQAQSELLDMRDRVASVEKSNAESVLTVQNRVESLSNVDERLTRIQREINDLWSAMDDLANPLQ